MMKKAILTTVLSSLYVAVSAQGTGCLHPNPYKGNDILQWHRTAPCAYLGTPETCVGKGKPCGTQKPVSFYARAGWNMSGGTSGSTIGQNGYDVNLGFAQNFCDSTGAYWGLQAGFVTRGYRVRHASNYGNEYRLRCHSFELNPNVGWFIPATCGGRLRVDPHVGVFASADFSQVEEGDYRMPRKNRNDLDWGVKAGVGLWAGHFNFDVAYRQGLSTFASRDCKTEVYDFRDAYSYSLSFCVGYVF